MDQIPVKSITITRVEGYAHECDKPATVPNFAEAHSLLHRWSASAPKDGTYDKCDFKVEWQDGQEYSGRYDLKHWSVERPDLIAHMTGHLRYLAGIAPAWMEDKPDVLARYRADRAANPEVVQGATDFLAKYELTEYAPAVTKGLRVQVYRWTLGDCTNGGDSAKYDTLLVVGGNIPAVFEPLEGEPVYELTQGPMGTVRLTPRNPKRPGKSGPMFGGNFAYGESRFAAEVERLGGEGFQAVKIFDRYEG